MINSDNTFGTFEIFCDFCDKSELFETDGDFRGFISEAKDLGWKISKDKNIWVHRCPTCAQEIVKKS
jgi:hypothetical protein